MYQRSIRRAGIVLMMCFVLLGLLVPAAVSAAPAQPDKQAVIAQEGYGGGFYYTVRPGDNLTRIANRYGTSVRAIMSANGLYSSVIYVGQVLYIPAGSGGGGGGGGGWCARTYIVQPGDTLSGIARWFGVSTQQLAAANNIYNPSHIYVGQRLCIPSGGGHPHQPPPPPPPPGPSCGQYYTVQPGDTLSEIARCCGTSVRNLAYLNGIWNPSHIYVGQVLRIY
jgi:LysM repeat protein